MTVSPDRQPGIVYTFYSYKGGVGRSMALANVAALLAKWGRSVLVVDWDLEASGIERFFVGSTPGLAQQRASTPGIADLICAKAHGEELRWSDCVLNAYPFGADRPVSIISAGRSDDTFVKRVQDLNFPQLFAESDLGAYIETLRSEWISNYEIVLIDSRTGITDIGGICTIHLPDVLVLLFTTTESSVQGVIDVTTKARAEQKLLPFDRRRLVALPVPARDESRTEHQKAKEWKAKFSERFAEFYADWMPADCTPENVLDILRIPYIPYWSFGENLPVVEEGTTDPMGLGYAYEVLARLVATDLEWSKVLSGSVLSTPVSRQETALDAKWLWRQRERAEVGLQQTRLKGFKEIVFYSPNASISVPQDELLVAARGATIHTFGWPIGVVLDNPEGRPKPTNEGIVAEITASTFSGYDYWSLTTRGQFYQLSSLFEDERGTNAIFFNTRIVRTAEALQYCSRLYRNLGSNGNTLVHFTLRYGRLRGRVLTATGKNRPMGIERPNSAEDEVTTEVSFLLSDVEDKLTDLTQKLCEPLFLVFDFARFDRAIYEQIVTDFIKGKVT
jgi:hypothetical protein